MQGEDAEVKLENDFLIKFTYMLFLLITRHIFLLLVRYFSASIFHKNFPFLDIECRVPHFPVVFAIKMTVFSFILYCKLFFCRLGSSKGFQQLNPEHRKLLPNLTKEQREGYFYSVFLFSFCFFIYSMCIVHVTHNNVVVAVVVMNN